MIKVTFEYATVDEAIVALGKLVGTAPVLAKANSTAATITRRGRSDKGQARGSYKNPPKEPTVPASSTGLTHEITQSSTVVATGAVAPEPAAPAVKDASGTAPTPVSDVTPAAAAPVYTEEHMKEALAKVFKATNVATAMAVLKRFGANTYRDVLPASYAEFIKHATFVSEGGAV